MGAVVRPGVIRIAGVNYNLSGMLMDRSDLVMDRSDLIMDNVGDSVTFDAASSTHFRYDSIVAGVDGDAHVVKGTNFLTTDTIPDPPAAPTSHVRLGWILIYPNMTSVSAADINRLVSDPVPTELRVAVADEELAWGELSTTITISVRDQYGNLIQIGGVGYCIEISWMRGNGTLSYGGVSQDESASLVFYMGSSAVVTYTRDGNDPGDESPMFSINESIVGLMNVAYVNLYNGAGDLM
jgi:hypothetical protein